MDPDLRGKIAEEKVFRVLSKLEGEGAIKAFGQTPTFGADDLKGIDFIIFPKKGKEIPLQVKSSYHRRSEEKYRKKGIHYLAVPPDQNEGETKENILKILENIANGQKKLEQF